MLTVALWTPAILIGDARGGHQLRQHCGARNFVTLIVKIILGPPIKFAELKYSLIRNSFFVQLKHFCVECIGKPPGIFFKFNILKYLLNWCLFKCEFGLNQECTSTLPQSTWTAHHCHVQKRPIALITDVVENITCVKTLNAVNTLPFVALPANSSDTVHMLCGKHACFLLSCSTLWKWKVFLSSLIHRI